MIDRNCPRVNMSVKHATSKERRGRRLAGQPYRHSNGMKVSKRVETWACGSRRLSLRAHRLGKICVGDESSRLPAAQVPVRASNGSRGVCKKSLLTLFSRVTYPITISTYPCN